MHPRILARRNDVLAVHGQRFFEARPIIVEGLDTLYTQFAAIPPGVIGKERAVIERALATTRQVLATMDPLLQENWDAIISLLEATSVLVQKVGTLLSQVSTLDDDAERAL